MNLIDSSDDEIEAFDGTCRRLGGFDTRIGTEWADGYLTALAAGPLALALDDWLPRLAGDAFERAFSDPEDVQRARAALASRWRVLQRHLDAEALLDKPDALRLQPLVATWDDEARAALVAEQGVAAEEAALLVTGAEWAEGFIDALEDFTAEWQPPDDAGEEDAALFEELVSHVHVLLLPEDAEAFKEHLAQHWKDRLATREDLLDEACFAIQDLRVWWLDHAPRPLTRRVEAVPGRNDPCPCGSGLKYKKCHGKGG